MFHGQGLSGTRLFFRMNPKSTSMDRMVSGMLGDEKVKHIKQTTYRWL